VTGDTLKKLQITQPEELAKLAPGLTLKNPNTDSGEITLRGVRWSAGSGPTATPIYLNESIFNSGWALQSLYDVGQIEVLRGPQGTRRGAPSISGAVTITTRRADLEQFGGYVQGSVGTRDHQMLQGAINVPIIKDILAIRVAGLLENSQGNGVRSLNNDADPSVKSRSYRIGVHFKPTDKLDINFNYQRLDLKLRQFSQAIGTGSLGNAALGIPVGYNGPPLTVKDYRAVGEAPRLSDGGNEFYTLNANWEVLGQVLTYNFSRGDSRPNSGAGSPVDPANMLPGFDAYPTTTGGEHDTMHEIRLSSQRGDHFFDYDIGYYNFKAEGPPIRITREAYLPGAFGRPGAVAIPLFPPFPGGAAPGAVTTPNSRYVLPVVATFGLKQKDESFYGNVQLHLPHDIELTGGLRHMRSELPVSLGVATGSAFVVAAPNFIFPAPCAFLSPVFGVPLFDSNYAGFCDLAVDPRTSSQVTSGKSKETLYNVSLSKRFGQNVLVYATTGTSFRPGYPAIGQTGLPADLAIPNPEKATSYEVGVKATLAPWLRINADVFQIDYKGQLVSFAGLPYWNTAAGPGQERSFTGEAFFANVDSRVRGLELEISTKPLDNLSLNAQVSYAKIESQGGIVPAGENDCPSAAPVSATNPINRCPAPKGTGLNTSAPWQFNVNGSYDLPLGPVDGYLRFNVNYQGRAPNFQTSFEADGSGFRSTKAYAIVDLFAGVTGGESAWDLGFYAKNLFNTKVLLTAQPTGTPYAGFGDSGYQFASATARREIGVTMRYSFGSR
ncbi:MAG TPA: TonB-dependent receptor, partial [Sphingobium sp.]|uniref:TonB-dependent receptor n=1 Tax=Sphingobium sp. TaxID=1912891 RepID=UPI002ED23C02